MLIHIFPKLFHVPPAVSAPAFGKSWYSVTVPDSLSLTHTQVENADTKTARVTEV